MSLPPYLAARDALRHRLEEWNWAGQNIHRQQILEAFLELALANGFNSVSMRMIAKAVNIKAPSLYAHFPAGRDEIVAESLRWHFHRFGMALIDAVKDASSADDFWDAMVRLHFTRQVRLPESNLWDLLVATDKMVGILPKELRAQVDDWVDLYEGMYVAAALDMGIRSPAEPVKIVMTLLEGATRWAPRGCDEIQLAELTERAVLLSRSVLKLEF